MAATGCVRSQGGLTREELTEQSIDRLVEQGIDEPLARCVIEHLFAEMSDVELRRFNLDGDTLSEPEAARIRQLTASCGG